MAKHKRVGGFFEYWYYQYLLHTSLYMLEPWERALFTTILLLLLSMSLYSAYIFLPAHALMVWGLVTSLFQSASLGTQVEL